jgi:PAS domain S-box-containing protein
LRRLSISGRLSLIVAAVAVPLNALIVSIIASLAVASIDAQRTSILYSARSVAAGVDAQLGKYLAIAEDLAKSPALLAGDIETFDREARQTLVAVPDAWALVSNLDGQEIVNTRVPRSSPLPMRRSAGIEAQRSAVSARSAVVSGVRRASLTNEWIATIEVPVFRSNQPDLVVSVAIRLPAFLKLLGVQQLPAGWLAGIIDGDGRFVARAPDNGDRIGTFASEGWRRNRSTEGVFQITSLEGDTIVQGNALSRMSSWVVGVGVKRGELLDATWVAVRWAVLLGGGVSLLSLLLAAAIARTIARPITKLRNNAAALVDGHPPRFEPGTPELGELWDALRRAVKERDRTQGELNQVSERLAAIVTSSTEGIVGLTLEGTITSWNASAERMFGHRAGDIIGQSVRLLIPAKRQHEEDEILARIARGELIEHYETVRLHKNGRPIEVSVSASPIRDGVGGVIGASKFVRDVTEKKMHERMLRESQQRLSQILDNVNAFVGLLDEEGKIVEVNNAALAAAGLQRKDVVGKSLGQASWWLPTPLAGVRIGDMISRAQAGERQRADLEYVARANAMEEVRWVDFQLVPIGGADGRVTAIVPSGVDITERKRAEQQVRALMLEINHRAKNMIGLVLAIARQTAASNPGEFIARYSERLQALAANQDILVKNEWRGADLDDLVRVQLAHFVDLIGSRITLDGPVVRLTQHAAQAIGMAMHELATNAGKYGALSNSEGEIRIDWELRDEQLSITWREHGGPVVERPTRSGFGQTVMTSLAQSAVGGHVTLEYAQSGIVWSLVCQAEKAIEPECTSDASLDRSFSTDANRRRRSAANPVRPPMRH